MEAAQGRTQEIVGQYKLHATDTGSPEVQVALLSARIGHGDPRVTGGCVLSESHGAFAGDTGMKGRS